MPLNMESEWKQCHQAYMFILDHMIETSLLDKFSKDDIGHFYMTFSEKLNIYQTKDPDVVKIFYQFIDFDTFKTELVNYKNDVCDV